eukprot:CAMPEP_0174280502 /NCGR_PEP_ID=MMETSP0809-20121228/791_1 /TAXON_ID=73025 ORGANISM="Eutreptiella gymnastica-like, Strain CCMP1594" /NCGR_SAMPLE_ID=MMETSP0809 /ASSEMBLY_ACC=CAM_ASM_000658 /LENGTH=86 /DNA_ID=CAMNT_0015373441 /DNA_START=6 /DNA_END=266 /DNA_ORIENTATION=+
MECLGGDVPRAATPRALAVIVATAEDTCSISQGLCTGAASVHVCIAVTVSFRLSAAAPLFGAGPLAVAPAATEAADPVLRRGAVMC